MGINAIPNLFLNCNYYKATKSFHLIFIKPGTNFTFKEPIFTALKLGKLAMTSSL